MAFCPRCSGNNVARSDGGYIEIGEWNGKQYEREFYVCGYRCRSCDLEFFVPGDVVLGMISDEAAEQAN